MFGRFNRVWFWWLLTLLALAGVACLRVAQLEVVLYKLSLVLLAGLLGLHLDRAVFPYARPDTLKSNGEAGLSGVAMQRRAIIMAGAMLAVAMGL